MDSNSELNPALPKETQDAIRAGLLEAEALDLERRAVIKDRLAMRGSTFAAPGGVKALRDDAIIFREEAQAKLAKADRLRRGVAK